MTHFATADEPGDAFLGEQLDALRRVGASRCKARTRASSCTRPTARRRCASRAAHFDLVRCGIAIYGMDPFGEDPAAHDLEPALRARVVRRRGQARRAGGERGLRAPVRRRASRPRSRRCRSATPTACAAG